MELYPQIVVARANLVGGEAWGLRIRECGHRCRDLFAGEDDVSGDIGAA